MQQKGTQYRWMSLATLGVIVWLSTACSSLGPDRLHDSHVSYNKAVQKAIMEEDLLNVVRLRYLDMPVSLSVSSIAAQTTFTVGSAGEFGVVEEKWTANILPGISYSDRPTITFTPARGQQFLESLAQPVPLETLVRLAATHSGMDVLLRVSVGSINGIVNPFNAAAPEFDRLALGLRTLEVRNGVRAGFLDRPVLLSDPIAADSVDADAVLAASRDGQRFRRQPDGSYQLTGRQSVPFLWIDPGYPESGKLLQQLRLEAGLASYELENAHQIGPPEADTKTLAVTTRSLLQIAVFLSHGVDVPEIHRSTGVAGPVEAQAPDLSDLFQVRVSRERPAESGIAVQYRDHWFYIPDSDHVSKRTFGLMQALFLSQIVEDAGQTAPVLTIPLN